MTKVISMTADATPTTDDLLYVVNDPAGTPTDRKVTLANLSKAVTGYVLYGGWSNASPADATTYYFGQPVMTSIITTTAATRKIRIPKAGTITRIDTQITVDGTLGTNQLSTLYLRLNNTTDTTLTSAVDFSVLYSEHINTGLSVAVIAGDYVEMKLLAATFATNPTTIRIQCQIWIE